MGPLTNTKQGVDVLVVMDNFSKFVRFFPVHRLTSREVVTYWKHDFSPLTGFLNRLSDKAKAFKSKAFLDFCFKQVITRINTTPYYPHNSLLERVNWNLQVALKIFRQSEQGGTRTSACWCLPLKQRTTKAQNSIPPSYFCGGSCPLLRGSEIYNMMGEKTSENARGF
jgi:hypothetical protein